MTPIHRSPEAFLLPLFCALVGGCSDPIDPEPDPVAAEIRFAVDDSLGLYAGESGPLGAAAYDANGIVIADAPMTWTVSNPAVVSVDSAGVITALGQGLVTVTASAGSISAAVTVRVTDFVQISAKQDPVCARDVEGQVWCIGTEWLGQVTWPHPFYEEWTQVSGDLAFTSLTSGYQFTCGLAGEAYCWGSNEDLRLGAGALNGSSAEPLIVENQPGFVSIDGGWSHTCGLDASGDAYCWGRGSEGQLGQGEFATSLPVLVGGDHTWRAIDAGGRTTCGVAGDGVTYCWGWAMSNANEVATPTAIDSVPANLEIIRVDAMACGAKNAMIYCWGPEADRPTPREVTMPDAVVDMVIGDQSVCALLASGDIYCWGSNHRSLLGDPALTTSQTPVKVDVDGRKFVAITGEWTLHCGLADDGGVYCWGGGSFIGRPFPFTDEPTRVPAPMP